MDNHYHLLLQTLEANLSRAMQWLNVSYTAWFNRRHQRVGHLLQGRFKAVVVEPETWALGLSRYVHLNPVRVGRLGLSKEHQRAQRQGAGVQASAELLAQRLRQLRQFRWSSYRAYGGYGPVPPWLEVRTVLGYGGGRQGERIHRYRAYVEEAVREGFAEKPWGPDRGQRGERGRANNAASRPRWRSKEVGVVVFIDGMCCAMWI